VRRKIFATAIATMLAPDRRRVSIAGVDSQGRRSAQLACTFAAVAALLTIACVHLRPSVREDIAEIWGGDANIYRLDGVWLHPPRGGRFEVRPGGHTVDAAGMAIRPGLMMTTTYTSGLVKLCVKARAGHAYKIKSRPQTGGLDLFFIDVETGEPPKTPCGPDEDDD
jgi:hypothetical protein